MKLTCYADGGCNNLTKSNGYGSFKVIYEDGEEVVKRLEFPDIKSSNEAEYNTLIHLLDYLMHVPEEFLDVDIYMDSKLVCEQVNGNWNVNAENIKPLNKLAIELIDVLDCCTLIWVPRKNLVRELGH